MLVRRSSTTPTSSRETPLDDIQKMAVLQRGLDALLVVELLVDRMLALVRALLDADVDAVPRGQGAQKTDAEGEAWKR
jgi:hypothetical protein